ncbi:unnamed protein product [Orchesella dallaii]|uniref:DUF1989 domain-containing protein n=1 Tax=Orchesella dallaii TaxID=48710 RepID=A0ABP1RZA4_9HEXA
MAEAVPAKRRKSSPWTYDHKEGGPLDVNRTFYGKLSMNPATHQLAEKFEIPIRSGKAWKVKAGQVCRLLTIRGPQVGDLNIWNLHNPRERMWAARTRQLQRAHITKFDRIWSTIPYLRPLLTITGDSLADYGVDEDGGRCHDLLGTRCDPYVNKMLTGEDFDFCCHSNLVRAVLPHGLTEFDVHDVLNVFQITGLDKNDRYFMKASPATPGDYFEFFAEIDLLCALSVCPGGDLSVPLWGPLSRDPIDTCNPIGVEIYDVEKELLGNWKSPETAVTAYKNLHGITLPQWK